jgi:hypothetical protein
MCEYLWWKVFLDLGNLSQYTCVLRSLKFHILITFYYLTLK